MTDPVRPAWTSSARATPVPGARDAPTTAAPRSRVGLTVRSRVVVAVIVLLALSLGVLTFADIELQRQSTIARIDDDLERRWNELLALTADGVDPETGRPFETADQLVRVAMARSVPAPNEGELGIVDGAIAWMAQPEVPLRLEDDVEFINHIAPFSTGDSVVRGSVTTSTSTYDFLVVPISLATDPGAIAGAVVFAFDRDAELDVVVSNLWWRLLLAAVVFVVGVATIWFLVGRLLRPIGLLRETAEEISDTDLSRRIAVHGSDDLAQLTATVNSMLDRLETAMTSQRELLDDVGHELRTPLTVVRGHLELMDVEDRDDAASTRELVVDEIDRMNRLVEDLTMLAASARPDFVTRETEHVGLLVDEALEKSKPLGDRRWRLGEFLDEEASLDPQRITQALLQLAANAVKFSEPGTAITFGAQAAGDRIRLSVRDEGRGIAPDHVDGLFERFRRVRASGDRIEGSGLGLAIVRNIAEAHDGAVEVESTLGRGSTFTLVLPRFTAPGPAADDELDGDAPAGETPADAHTDTRHDDDGPDDEARIA